MEILHLWEINSFNRNEFNAQSIKSNFKEIVTYPKFYKSGFLWWSKRHFSFK